MEEYPIEGEPELEPLIFIPVKGTQDEIPAKHQNKRRNIYPDNSPFFAGQPGIPVQLGNEKLMAEESYSDPVLGASEKNYRSRIAGWEDQLFHPGRGGQSG